MLFEACPPGAERDELLGNLEREAALERMKEMGKGVTLVSHEKKALPDGGVQSLVVCRIPNITDLRVSNPFVHEWPAGKLARIQYGQIRSRDLTWVKVNPLSRRIQYPRGMVRKAATPLERQILRELRPVVADMLSDFTASLKLKVPTRLRGGQVRNLNAGPRTTTLFSLSGKDLDRHGLGFFENEEILLALLRMDFNAHAIINHTRAFPHNSRTPVLRSRGASFSIMPTTYQTRQYRERAKKKGKQAK
jgi:hypothetical protein